MTSRPEDRQLAEFYYGMDPLDEQPSTPVRSGYTPSRTEQFRSDPLSRVLLFFLLLGIAGAVLLFAIMEANG